MKFTSKYASGSGSSSSSSSSSSEIHTDNGKLSVCNLQRTRHECTTESAN